MHGKPMLVKDLGKSARSLRFLQTEKSVCFLQHHSAWNRAVSHATS